MFECFVLVGFILIGGSALAEHPNEGSASLEMLLKEASENSLEIREAEANLSASVFDSKSKLSSLSPSLSLEVAPQTTKIENEKNSGTAVYGKVEWNLYRGGKDSAELEKAKIFNKVNEKRVEAVKARVNREVSRLYYELLFLLESADLKRKAIEMNLEQTKLGRLKRTSGFTSSADVIEFELRDATLNSDLKMITQEASEKSRELAVVLGRTKTSEISLAKGHLIRDESKSLTKELVMSQLDENLDVLEARAGFEISQTDAKIAKTNYLPTLDLEAKYGKLANEELVYEANNNYSVALKFSLPLFSGLKTVNQSKSARSLVKANEAAATQKKLLLLSEVENYFSKLATLNDRLNLEEKNLSKSEEYYKITLAEYNRGVKNSPDMVGASERLLEARIRNLEYRKDYQLTKLKIYGLVSGDSIKITTSLK